MADRVSVLRDMLGDDLALHQHVVQVFADTAPPMRDGIRAAAADARSAELAQAAHKLKGAALNFGPSEAVRLCEALECLGNAGGAFDAREARALSAALGPAVDELLAELRAATAPAGPTGEAAR